MSRTCLSMSLPGRPVRVWRGCGPRSRVLAERGGAGAGWLILLMARATRYTTCRIFRSTVSNLGTDSAERYNHRAWFGPATGVVTIWYGGPAQREKVIRRAAGLSGRFGQGTFRRTGTRDYKASPRRD